MTYITEKDFLIEVALGKVAGHSLVHKFGRNDTVPNGSFEFINLLGFTDWPLSAPTTVRVKAGGNVNDVDTTGTGARKIIVEGIDTTFAETTEEIALAGASASSATSTSFWRVHRAFVSVAGTYGAANTGAITVENSGGGTDLIQIGIEEGQSQFSGWSVPLGKTAHLLSINCNADANKAADIRMFTREDLDDAVAPLKSKRLRLFFDGVVGQMRHQPRSPDEPFPAKSDIWFEAQGSGAMTEVSLDFELLIVDD